MIVETGREIREEKLEDTRVKAQQALTKCREAACRGALKPVAAPAQSPQR